MIHCIGGGFAERKVNGAAVVFCHVPDDRFGLDQPGEMAAHCCGRRDIQQQQLFQTDRPPTLLMEADLDGDVKILVSFYSRQVAK